MPTDLGNGTLSSVCRFDNRRAGNKDHGAIAAVGTGLLRLTEQVSVASAGLLCGFGSTAGATRRRTRGLLCCAVWLCQRKTEIWTDDEQMDADLAADNFPTGYVFDV
jgi:hypothetical protein